MIQRTFRGLYDLERDLELKDSFAIVLSYSGDETVDGRYYDIRHYERKHLMNKRKVHWCVYCEDSNSGTHDYVWCMTEDSAIRKLSKYIKEA